MNDRQWTGVLLAGGQSSRMGRDKALIEIDGVSMLQRGIGLLRPHAKEILVIGDPAKYAPDHARVVPDDTPGNGPLGGIITALKHARYVRLIVLACDLPHINDRLLMHLKQGLVGDVDAVVPRHDALLEPLAATYHRHAIEAFQRNVAESRLKMSDAIAKVNAQYLDVVPGQDGWPADLFRNLNSPADL